MKPRRPIDEPYGDDRLLARRIVANEEGALLELWERHSDALLRFVSRRLGTHVSKSSDLVDDIVHDVMVQAPETLKNYRGEGSLLSFLCGVSRNAVRRQERSGSRFATRGAEEAHVEPEAQTRAESEQTRERVHEALDLLTSADAQLLEWKYAEDLPVREIAARLEITEKATESRLTRARSAFRRAFRTLNDIDRSRA